MAVNAIRTENETYGLIRKGDRSKTLNKTGLSNRIILRQMEQMICTPAQGRDREFISVSWLYLEKVRLKFPEIKSEL